MVSGQKPLQFYVLSEDRSFIFHRGELTILKRKKPFWLILGKLLQPCDIFDFSAHISVDAACDIKKDSPEQKVSVKVTSE